MTADIGALTRNLVREHADGSSRTKPNRDVDYQNRDAIPAAGGCVHED